MGFHSEWYATADGTSPKIRSPNTTSHHDVRHNSSSLIGMGIVYRFMAGNSDGNAYYSGGEIELSMHCYQTNYAWIATKLGNTHKSGKCRTWSMSIDLWEVRSFASNNVPHDNVKDLPMIRTMELPRTPCESELRLSSFTFLLQTSYIKDGICARGCVDEWWDERARESSNINSSVGRKRKKKRVDGGKRQQFSCSWMAWTWNCRQPPSPQQLLSNLLCFAAFVFRWFLFCS